MRNPIRLKNLSLRFAPWYLVGLLLLLLADVRWPDFAAGLAPIALGLAVRAWGAGHLVKNDRFTVTGPYAHLRHPLYLGALLIAGGFALMLGGWLGWLTLGGVLAWFALAYYPRKERVEAARLETRYGAVFACYREQVPALRPRLRAWRPQPAQAEKVAMDVRWSFACYDHNNELGTLIAVLAGVGGFAAQAAAG